MEFPELGKQCSISDCNDLDFLPHKCSYCENTYCKEHAEVSKHECSGFVDNIVSEKKKSPTYKCNAENCEASDPVEMKCVKCEKHFCLQHRHHGCLDDHINKSLSKREKQKMTKEQFKKAKADTDAVVQEKLKKAGNRALVNKIKLMKIKGFAVGQKNIPTTSRIYFLVAPPLGSAVQSKAKALFVDKTWSYGRAIDFISKKLNAENTNNNPDDPQLRLFSAEGELIKEELSELLQTILDNGSIVDGDSLILEYIKPEEIAENYNVFVNERTLNKYTFI